MGSESVELVRRVYVAWQEGDLEELLLLVDREVAWSPVLASSRGRGPPSDIRGFGDGFAGSGSPTGACGPCRETFEDHGSRVLVLGRLVGASRLEEGDLDVRVSWVWTVRAGRVVEMKAFLEERSAREELASSG